MKPLEKCCCCFPLRTGGFVVGCLYIVVSIVVAIWNAVASEEIPTTRTLGEEIMRLAQHVFLLTYTTGVITIVVFAIYLCGIFVKISWFLLPAMIWHVFVVALQTFILAYGAVSVILGGKERFMETLKYSIPLLILMAFQWYSIIVSYSLFRQIKTPVAVIRSDRKDAEANTAEELSNLKRGNGEAGAVPPTDSPK